MAHQYNGYVYHTRFDVPEIVPRGTFQNTGDNVLALVRELANAPELEDPSVSTIVLTLNSFYRNKVK